MAIVNAKLMANYAVAFNIGADILNMGNRAIDQHLGAEKKSGDTVYVPIMDGGEVFDTLDLTGKDLSVARDEIPVTVRPLSTGAVVTQEDLTLSIQNPEIMAKRVAKQANEANIRAFRCLEQSSQAFFAVSRASEDIRRSAFDAEAYTVGSKISGETYGVTHPSTWNRIVSTLQANFAPNNTIGNKLYSNELGDFMGFKWSKGNESTIVNWVDTSFGNVSFVDGSDEFVHSGAGPQNVPIGYVSGPFGVTSIYGADALGYKVSQFKTFRARWDGAQWRLTTPVFFTGARKSAHSDTNEWAVPHSSFNQFQPNINYLSPAIIWKEADFLIAVKGVEKFAGCDSFTIPTSYKDKGILPLRGTYWTDPIKASSIFRVDVLLGMSMYQAISNASIYIPLDEI